MRIVINVSESKGKFVIEIRKPEYSGREAQRVRLRNFGDSFYSALRSTVEEGLAAQSGDSVSMPGAGKGANESN